MEDKLNTLLSFYREVNNHPRSLYSYQNEAFMVDRRVWHPQVGITEIILHYINANSELVLNKSVIDCGCGCGVLGLAAAMNGAVNVTLTDVDTWAAENADRNISNFELFSRAQAVEGNLLEDVSHTADLIFFNHLFIQDKEIMSIASSSDWLFKSFFDEGSLLDSFLYQALSYLEKGGVILIPIVKDVSDVNRLVNTASKRGLFVKIVYWENAKEGEILLYQLTKR